MTKNILIIGSGAREHALVATLARSKRDIALYCFAPSVNPAIEKLVCDYGKGDILDVPSVVNYAKKHHITMVVVGPEAPLEKGIADALWDNGIATIGPKQDLAQLETSKGFTRQLLTDYNIDGNPFYQHFASMDGVEDTLKNWQDKHVIKADGLMGGKGVKVCGDHLFSLDDSMQYCRELIDGGGQFVVEEKIVGQEFSLISFCDGKTLIHMPAVQDHKRAFEGDTGPNTGGMGTYSDANHSLPFISDSDIKQAQAINEKVARAVGQKYNDAYKGILYGGFMATAEGVKLIEYNARFGDPEAMNLLTLLQTDFVDIFDAMVNGTLDTLQVDFAKKATVCKYVVPDGYPDSPRKGDVVDMGGLSPDVPVFLGAVDVQNGALIATGSRTLAVVGIAHSITDAEKIAQAEVDKIKGAFFHRKDIGTADLINVRIDHMNDLRGAGTYAPLKG